MTNFLDQLYNLVIFAAILLLGGYVVAFINAKTQELKAKYNSNMEQKYIERINDIITTSVLTTTQTYVESLKKKGEFGVEAQKEAFNKTKDAVMGLLTDELKEFITESFGDINIYLTNQIETSVSKNKANS